MNELTVDNSGLPDFVKQLTPDEQIRMRDALRDCTSLDTMPDIMADACDSVHTSSVNVIRAALKDIQAATNMTDRQLWEPVQTYIGYDRFREARYLNENALTQKEWNLVENEYAHYVRAYQEGVNNAG